jgi:hypothetical protein
MVDKCKAIITLALLILLSSASEAGTRANFVNPFHKLKASYKVISAECIFNGASIDCGKFRYSHSVLADFASAPFVLIQVDFKESSFTCIKHFSTPSQVGDDGGTCFDSVVGASDVYQYFKTANQVLFSGQGSFEGAIVHQRTVGMTQKSEKNWSLDMHELYNYPNLEPNPITNVFDLKIELERLD